MDKIQIGDSQKKVQSIFGNSSPEIEDSSPLSLQTFQYPKKDGRPDIVFTIDPKSQLVVGKAQWLYNDDSSYDLNVLKNQLSNASFQSFVPCHTWSDKDAILANQDKGLYIAVDHGHAAFVSWSTPELVKVRIDLLYKTCPRLQPSLR